MKKIAVSIGDVNGIGLEIALRAHEIASKNCEIVYFVDFEVLKHASEILKIPIPRDFNVIDIAQHCSNEVQRAVCKKNLISPHAQINKLCGEYSFVSFLRAVESAKNTESCGIVTLPIHKKAWQLARIPFVGHTDFLSAHFGQKGIMMLGCKEMFVALFSDHIPLKKVSETIKYDDLLNFLRAFAKCHDFTQALVLGLNPHAGDNGVLGDEESIINRAIDSINNELGFEKFKGAISPDIAFAPHIRAKYSTFVAMYHDQGLAPLKALYFDESINVTLGLPILRASVDHGVAFDIAYANKARIQSYLAAINFVAERENG